MIGINLMIKTLAINLMIRIIEINPTIEMHKIKTTIKLIGINLQISQIKKIREIIEANLLTKDRKKRIKIALKLLLILKMSTKTLWKEKERVSRDKNPLRRKKWMTRLLPQEEKIEKRIIVLLKIEKRIIVLLKIVKRKVIIKLKSLREWFMMKLKSLREIQAQHLTIQ